jgi:molybdenum cofactor cytidylyltransferase
MFRHDALILAAGGSRRLGESKQSLQIHGESHLARAIRLTHVTEPASVLVVIGTEPSIDTRTDGAVTWLQNSSWRTGLASSLQLAAERLSGRGRPVLMRVVDQPALEQSHLSALLHAFDGSNDVVTAYGSAVSVPALVRPTTLARASELVGDEGLRKRWHSCQPDHIRCDPLAFDIDTPADAAAAREAGLLDHPE